LRTRRGTPRIAALTALWFSLLAGPASSADRRVAIAVFDYRPKTVTVNPGDSVTWRWSGPDTNHSVRAVRSESEDFDSDPGRPVDGINHEIGATFRHTFTKPGRFDYLCLVHPRFMRGTVVVKAVPDRAAPRIHSLRTSASRLRFGLSERARMSAQIRPVGRPMSSKPVRTMRFTGRRGRNDVPLRTRGLPPARYRITVTATDEVGNVSKPASARVALR
jgi:plastocyanin